MKRFSTFMLMLIMVCFSAFAKKDYLKYDITGAGSGTEGTCLVKVFIYKKSASDAQFKAAAVHGVIFRGFNGTESRVDQPALTTPDTEAQYQEFYDSFIDEKGECQNYAEIVTGSYERIKTKKGYKVGVIVQVNRKALRASLEKARVIKSLNSIF